MEEARNGDTGQYISYEMDKNNNPKPIGFAVEIADTIIRLADLCGGLGVPLEESLRIKLAYNKTRAHKHGKIF